MRGVELLASYPLFLGELPPTIIDSLWHGRFAKRRNVFAIAYTHRSESHERFMAQSYLQLFGRTKEEQVRTYYLWAQTVPKPAWRFFEHLPLSLFTSYVADMVPPLAVANLLRSLDVAHYFKGSTVLDLYAGVGGWLMAFYFYPSHALPERWVAVDIDAKRLAIVEMVGRDLGVDVQTVRRDLRESWENPPRADVVVGSPPCHDFSVANVKARKADHGLQLVQRYFDIAEAVEPELAVMEEAVTLAALRREVESMASRYRYRWKWIDLRDLGAIQRRRRRFIAWREGDGYKGLLEYLG
ncbi:MAG: DNA cytosine methyltransferase [Thermofilum sp.]|nr:DNA cytosine methyltransferase [Thermofilum sp.]